MTEQIVLSKSNLSGIIITNVQIAVDIYYNLMLWTKFRPVVVSSADTFLGGDEEGGGAMLKSRDANDSDRDEYSVCLLFQTSL